jgi:hypothetical protein
MRSSFLYMEKLCIGQKLDMWIFQFLVGLGDMEDIQKAVAPEMAPKWDEMTVEEIRRQVG